MCQVGPSGSLQGHPSSSGWQSPGGRHVHREFRGARCSRVRFCDRLVYSDPPRRSARELAGHLSGPLERAAVSRRRDGFIRGQFRCGYGRSAALARVGAPRVAFRAVAGQLCGRIYRQLFGTRGILSIVRHRVRAFHPSRRSGPVSRHRSGIHIRLGRDGASGDHECHRRRPALRQHLARQYGCGYVSAAGTQLLPRAPIRGRVVAGPSCVPT